MSSTPGPGVNEMSRAELEAEVGDLRDRVNRLEELISVDAESPSEATIEDVQLAGNWIGSLVMRALENSKTNQQQLEGLEDGVSLTNDLKELKQKVRSHDEKLEIIGVDGIEPDTPDKRALNIRVWLYEQANKSKNGKASLDKDSVVGVIGNLQRTQRYEAMRRAAEGNSHPKLNGTSDLSAVQGIEFQQFDASDERNTRVVIDLEAVTREFGQKIIDMRDEVETTDE